MPPSPSESSRNSKIMAGNHSGKLTTEEDRSFLPMDIIELVLLCLAAKPLLRFRSVCKTWYTMISDFIFVRTHLRRSKSSNSENLFIHKSSNCKGFSLSRIEDRKLQKLETLKSPNGWETILCYCDGVLLLTDYSYNLYILWNPSRTIVMKFWFPYKFNDYQLCYGLCHDPVTDDFKIVIISSNSNYYAAYSCSNRIWTKKKEFSYRGPLKMDSGVSVNGAVYWICKHKIVKEIIYFDSRDDEIKILPKPKGVDSKGNMYLADLRGSLCLYCNGRDESVVEIWAKEKGVHEYSWKELMTVENLKKSVRSFEPICFVENKIAIRLDVPTASTLVVYNPCENTFEEFIAENLNADLRGVMLVPYVESLLCPIQKRGLERKRKCLL